MRANTSLRKLIVEKQYAETRQALEIVNSRAAEDPDWHDDDSNDGFGFGFGT